MKRWLLHHTHHPRECGPAYAAWRGFTSPLRRRPVATSCRFGGHELWWIVDADDEDEALALLPAFVAKRTTATRVDDFDVA